MWFLMCMTEAEKATYEALLKELKDARQNEKTWCLDKLEKFISIVNIRINKAIPQGWEIP